VIALVDSPRAMRASVIEDRLTSPVPLNRQLRRLRTQLPEGARIAPGRAGVAAQGCCRAGQREARIRITLFR
jgi:hypothetical protein